MKKIGTFKKKYTLDLYIVFWRQQKVLHTIYNFFYLSFYLYLTVYLSFYLYLTVYLSFYLYLTVYLSNFIITGYCTILLTSIVSLLFPDLVKWRVTEWRLTVPYSMKVCIFPPGLQRPVPRTDLRLRLKRLNPSLRRLGSTEFRFQLNSKYEILHNNQLKTVCV